MLVDQRPGQRDDVFGLGVEQTDGFDRVSQRFFAKIHHLLRSLDAREQRPAGDIDAGVGCLRGKDDGDEQLVRVTGFELGRR